MNAKSTSNGGDLYARCITASEGMHPDLGDKATCVGSFDRSREYLLGGLTPIPEGVSVSGEEKRVVSRTLKRIGASLFRRVERFISANVLTVSGDHGLGDQIALEARVRFSDEEFKRRERTGSRRCPHSGERT